MKEKFIAEITKDKSINRFAYAKREGSNSENEGRQPTISKFKAGVCVGNDYLTRNFFAIEIVATDLQKRNGVDRKNQNQKTRRSESV